MDRRRFLAAAAAFATMRASAQQTHGRAVSIVIPFAPGGASDVVARTLADGLAAELGRPVIVENKGGAGGLIAAGAVGRAAADGSTLLYGNQGQMVVARHLMPNNGILPLELLAPVAMTARTTFVLVVPTDSPYATARELIAAARSRTLQFGIPGVGSPPHLATAMLGETTGTTLQVVPYQGSGPMLVDLGAGRLDAAFDNVATSLGQIRAGRLRALGVSAPRRSTAAADVPTLAESGVDGYAYQAWQGVFAPIATPRDVVDTIEAGVRRAIEAPSVRKRLEESGLEVDALGQDAFRAAIARDAAHWEALVRKGTLKPA